MLSETSVVVYNPHGLGALTRADAALWAAAHDRTSLKAGRSLPSGRIAGVVPIPAGIPTVAVSYLYVSRYTSRPAPSLARSMPAIFITRPRSARS